jgi:transposase
MAYIKSLQGQNWLFPPNINDMIDENHICFLVEKFVEDLDYSDFDEKFDNGPGHPAYHRRVLLKILIQGMLDRVRSSRKLARASKENLVYMYLAERLNPDFRTISDFRKNNLGLLENVFKETVLLAKEMSLVSVEMFCTDGTKIKANAGKKRLIKREAFDWLDEYIQNELEKGIEQDRIEDELEKKFDKNNKRQKWVKKEIRRTVQEYMKKLKENSKKAKLAIKKTHQAIREQLKKDDLKNISLTDPESRLMLMKKGYYESAYNAQITVDSKKGIIVANDLCQENADDHQGIPQLEQAEQNIGPLPKGLKICDDAGYKNPKLLAYLEKKKLDGYIPQKQQRCKEENKQFNKEFFKYNEKKDVFICPDGREMPHRKTYFNKSGRPTKNYYGSCAKCSVSKQCKGKKDTRVISASPYEASLRRMKAKMQLKKSKEIYAKRQEIVEILYAHIKHNIGFTEFLTRGIKSAKSEFNLACTASNLRRIWTQIKKTNRNITQLKQHIKKNFYPIFTPTEM